MNLKNISITEMREELKKRGLGIYPLGIVFTAGIKWPITNRKQIGKEPLPYKTEYKK